MSHRSRHQGKLFAVTDMGGYGRGGVGIGGGIRPSSPGSGGGIGGGGGGGSGSDAPARSATVSALEEQLGREEANELQELFRLVDKDGGGSISQMEFSELLHSMAVRPSPIEVRATDSGSARCSCAGAMRCRHWYDSLDEIADSSLCTIVPGVAVWQMDLMYGELDSDGDANLSYEEFLRFMTQPGVASANGSALIAAFRHMEAAQFDRGTSHPSSSGRSGRAGLLHLAELGQTLRSYLPDKIKSERDVTDLLQAMHVFASSAATTTTVPAGATGTSNPAGRGSAAVTDNGTKQQHPPPQRGAYVDYQSFVKSQVNPDTMPPFDASTHEYVITHPKRERRRVIAALPMRAVVDAAVPPAPASPALRGELGAAAGAASTTLSATTGSGADATSAAASSTSPSAAAALPGASGGVPSLPLDGGDNDGDGLASASSFVDTESVVGVDGTVSVSAADSAAAALMAALAVADGSEARFVREELEATAARIQGPDVEQAQVEAAAEQKKGDQRARAQSAGLKKKKSVMSAKKVKK
jgi:hypothetical protein